MFIKILKKCGIVFAALMFLYLIISLTFARNAGTVMLFLFTFFILILSVDFKFKNHRKLYALIKIAGCAYMLLCIAVSGIMISSIFNTPPNSDLTLIVLGCQVKGTSPENAYISAMLQRRLDTALEYLRSRPDTPVIVSGGRGSDEPVSEAEAMRAYLLKNGISASQIYIENKSVSTVQNIEFSVKVMRENNLPKTAAIVTDGFHEYRAGVYCGRLGARHHAVPAKTELLYLPVYWFREIAGAVWLIKN